MTYSGLVRGQLYAAPLPEGQPGGGRSGVLLPADAAVRRAALGRADAGHHGSCCGDRRRWWECDIAIPHAAFDSAFPWIRYDDSITAGRFNGDDWSDDGRPLQWLMSVEKVNDSSVRLDRHSILDDVECDGTALVSPNNTATDDRYVMSTDPFDWIPYIIHWQQLEQAAQARRCPVDVGLHRAYTRFNSRPIDMGLQVN